MWERREWRVAASGGGGREGAAVGGVVGSGSGGANGVGYGGGMVMMMVMVMVMVVVVGAVESGAPIY